MPKFEIGQKVRVKGLNKSGEIKAYKIEGYILKGNAAEVTTYQINFGSYFNDWYKETDLESSYEFEPKFERGLADLMIDINLASKNIHMARNFYNVKQTFVK